jgi:hypothetical protein
MPVIYSNNASTTLSSGINNSTTTIPIASATGFPSITGSDYFFATIANTNNTKIEIVKVTAGTTSLTVVRGQDGTTAQAFDSGDNFQVRVTSATLEAATKTDVNITGGAIATAAISDDAVTAAKLANSINTDIATGVTGNTTANAALPKSGGAMTGAITTNSTFDGVDIATRDGVLTSTTTTANAALPKAGGAMTGAITTNSTFDGVDIATRDGVLTSTTTTANAALPKAGGTMSGDLVMDGNEIHLADNGEIRLGSAADLKIYHDGGNSVIKDEGTGDLLIQGADQIKFMNVAGSEYYAVLNEDGAVQLYHNGSEKIATTAAGATVTGVLTATLQANAIDSDHYVDGSIDQAHLAADCVVGSKIADDTIDSEHYVDGSIDAAHLASDSVTEAKVAANSIDSQAYVDGSIDNEHFSASLGDMRKQVTYIGYDGGDYIRFNNNTNFEFYVNGNEEMRLEADGDLHVDGDVIAYSTTISDATLKYNINPVEFALDKIKQLKGVTFNYFKDNKASAGLLAQDVEKVMPSAVSERKLPLHTGDDKSYKTLHYDSMTAILVEAIKELTAKVEKLENK